MKKLILSVVCLALLSITGKAQVSGTVTGVVLDPAQNPISGIAVFFYGTDTDPSTNTSFVKEEYEQVTYTDWNGNYSFNYTTNAFDSVGVGVLDCQSDIVAKTYPHYPNTTTYTTNLQIVTCVPDPCDLIMTIDTMLIGSNTYANFEVLLLRDSSLIIGYYGPNQISHQWTFSDNYQHYSHRPLGTNRDTVLRPLSGLPSSLTYCYSRLDTLCLDVCDTFSTSMTPLTCKANFFVDTVNSINFQGQVVVWENSSTSAGNIISYLWDFGDGNTSTLRYPIHTYNDTNIYNLCLTITAVNGTDTCTDTFCDSVGFDSNGNLVYKTGATGFTINVIDPATVGQEENAVDSYFDLYPNPGNGELNLSWDGNTQVENIKLISINGQVIKDIRPTSAAVQLSNIKAGVYIMRIESTKGLVTRKVIVN